MGPSWSPHIPGFGSGSQVGVYSRLGGCPVVPNSRDVQLEAPRSDPCRLHSKGGVRRVDFNARLCRSHSRTASWPAKDSGPSGPPSSKGDASMVAKRGSEGPSWGTRATMPSRVSSARERERLREQFDELAVLFVQFSLLGGYEDEVLVILQIILIAIEDCWEELEEAKGCKSHQGVVSNAPHEIDSLDDEW
eukprot:scaffold644_cov357-Pavlova_lutheri.AAC.8